MLITPVYLFQFACVLVFSNSQKLSVSNFKRQNGREQLHRFSLKESEVENSEYLGTFFI